MRFEIVDLGARMLFAYSPFLAISVLEGGHSVCHPPWPNVIQGNVRFQKLL